MAKAISDYKQEASAKPTNMATKPFPPLFFLTWLVIFQAGQSCEPSGYLPGTPGDCNTENNSECCKAGESYPKYQCSPDITGNTAAKMTLNGFNQGEDGGGASKCDEQYHSNTELIVALSTGWYDNGSRCLKTIQINNARNRKSVLAKVVDECDSVNGCDADHGFQPPCANNIVDASRAVWEKLEIPESEFGDYEITWSDA